MLYKRDWYSLLFVHVHILKEHECTLGENLLLKDVSYYIYLIFGFTALESDQFNLDLESFSIFKFW